MFARRENRSFFVEKAVFQAVSSPYSTNSGGRQLTTGQEAGVVEPYLGHGFIGHPDQYLAYGSAVVDRVRAQNRKYLQAVVSKSLGYDPNHSIYSFQRFMNTWLWLAPNSIVPGLHGGVFLSPSPSIIRPWTRIHTLHPPK